MRPAWIRMRWERHTRYYEAHLHPDLWGQWVLTRVWGRRGERLGRVVHIPYPSYADALEALAAVERRRNQHGYVRVQVAPARCAG